VGRVAGMRLTCRFLKFEMDNSPFCSASTGVSIFRNVGLGRAAEVILVLLKI